MILFDRLGNAVAGCTVLLSCLAIMSTGERARDTLSGSQGYRIGYRSNCPFHVRRCGGGEASCTPMALKMGHAVLERQGTRGCLEHDSRDFV